MQREYKKLAIYKFDGRNKKIKLSSEWSFKKPICEDIASQLVKDHAKKYKLKNYCYELLKQVY